MQKQSPEFYRTISTEYVLHLFRSELPGLWPAACLKSDNQPDRTMTDLDITGTTRQKATGVVCFGFNSQKCRLSIHGILWSQSAPDIYAFILSGGYHCASQARGNVEDLAGT